MIASRIVKCPRLTTPLAYELYCEIRICGIPCLRRSSAVAPLTSEPLSVTISAMLPYRQMSYSKMNWETARAKAFLSFRPSAAPERSSLAATM